MARAAKDEIDYNAALALVRAEQPDLYAAWAGGE